MKKFIIVIVAVITIVVALLFGIKFYKVNKIVELMKKNSKIDNYSYIDNEGLIIKRYKKKVIIILGDFSDFYYYYDFDDSKKEYYVIDEKSKTYYKSPITEKDKDNLIFPLYNYLTTDYSFKNKLKLVFELKIRNFDNNRYEIITKKNDKIIFDKNTGYILEASNLSNNNTYDKNKIVLYINILKNTDLKLPELTKYEELLISE